MKNKRLITKRTSAKKTAAVGKKLKKEIGGTFRNQARRDGQGDNARAGDMLRAAPDPKGHAGELLIEGAITAGEKAEFMGLIRHTGATGPKDPDDRVLSVELTSNGMRITTAHNRLAIAIGKKLHRARKGGTLTITWSPGDQPVRVHWKKP